MKTRHRVPRGIKRQLIGSTSEKKIANVTVGNSTGGSVGLTSVRNRARKTVSQPAAVPSDPLPPVPFRGVGVALLTFFDVEGELDAAATAEHAARLADVGIGAVVVAGTTGEAATLDRDERLTLLRAVRAAVPATVVVVAGTGAPSARQAVELSRDAREAGADCLLALSPPWSLDVRPYYASVVAAVPDLPVLAYHWPAASAPGIPVAALGDLPVDGLKDSSGDAGRLLETFDAWDRPVYVGAPTVVGLAAELGGPGAILGIANAEPQRAIAAWAGDPVAQRELASIARDGASPFPAALKRLTARRYGTPETCRVF
jgi:4-hydroxy-tetrahydrodipicolinate synthase